MVKRAIDIQTGDTVYVQGNKGIVVEIEDTRCHENYDANGKRVDAYSNSLMLWGRYFRVLFDKSTAISGTYYDNSFYGGNHRALYAVE